MKKKRGIYKIRKTINIILVAACFIVFTALIISIKSIIVEAANLDTSSFTQITGKDIDEGGKPSNETLPKYDVLITINNEKEVGRVNNYFYGTNVHSSWLRKGRYVDANADSNNEAPSDLKWHRQMFLESGMRYVREDARVDECYYVNSSNLSHWERTCDLTNQLEEYEWAKQNGVRILNILSYMPAGLRNLSANCSSNPQKCEPLDYDIWGKILVDYINATTLNGYYLDIVDYEIWNEPDLRIFLLPDLKTHGSQQAADVYVKLYNASYANIKAIYPNVVIIGPSSAHIDIYTNITFSFLSNFSDKMDGVSAHNYYPVDGKSVMIRTQNILGYCKDYSANCSRILINEYNYKNKSNVGGGMELSNSRLYNYFADIFSDGLNFYPENLSLMIYQWSEAKRYLPNVSYPEYPSRWSMVSEPQLDNEFYLSYNVTKDFARYHAYGNMIVNSSSSNNSIKSVASLNSENIWHITIINTGTSNTNININISSTNTKAIKDLSNDKIYPVNNGIVNVGVLTEYDVKHYEGLYNYEPQNSTEEKTTPNTFSNKDTSTKTDELTTSKDITKESNFNEDNISKNKHVDEEKAPKSSKKTEEENEDFSTKGYSDDVAGTNKSNLSSNVSISKSYIAIIIFLTASIILTCLIIYIIYKKKRESRKVR